MTFEDFKHFMLNQVSPHSLAEDEVFTSEQPIITVQLLSSLRELFHQKRKLLGPDYVIDVT